MAFITVGDVQMFYEDLGKPDGLPIVMLHGFTGTGRADWIHQIDRFRFQLSPDSPGSAWSWSE